LGGEGSFPFLRLIPRVKKEFGEKLPFLNFNCGKRNWGPRVPRKVGLFSFLKTVGLFQNFSFIPGILFGLGRNYWGGIKPKGKGLRLKKFY